MKLQERPRNCSSWKATDKRSKYNEWSAADPFAAKEIIGVAGQISGGFLGDGWVFFVLFCQFTCKFQITLK